MYYVRRRTILNLFIRAVDTLEKPLSMYCFAQSLIPEVRLSYVTTSAQQSCLPPPALIFIPNIPCELAHKDFHCLRLAFSSEVLCWSIEYFLLPHFQIHQAPRPHLTHIAQLIALLLHLKHGKGIPYLQPLLPIKRMTLIIDLGLDLPPADQLSSRHASRRLQAWVRY